jgi:hypothetical protein
LQYQSSERHAAASRSAPWEPGELNGKNRGPEDGRLRKDQADGKSQPRHVERMQREMQRVHRRCRDGISQEHLVRDQEKGDQRAGAKLQRSEHKPRLLRREARLPTPDGSPQPGCDVE